MAYSSASDAVTAAPPAASRAAAGVVVQPGHTAFPDMAEHIVKEFGFDLLQLAGYDIHRPQSKWTHLRGLARQSLQLIGYLPRFRRSDCIVAIGPISYLVKLLRRLGLIRYRRSCCMGWHVRSPSWFPLMRLLSRLDSPGDHYILFSDFEIELYRTHLAIDPRRMHWLPYGEWGSVEEPAPVAPPSGLPAAGYYFAGGYSNRDYLPLIEAFRAIGLPLVIVCSALNSELDGIELPVNVTLLRDLPSDQFGACMRQAKACIVPLKYDTGASGQSVILRAMRQRTLVIASDFGSVRGYIEDGVSGYLVREMAGDLAAVVARVERDPAAAQLLAEAANRRYREHFSPEIGAAALSRIIASVLA